MVVDRQTDRQKNRKTDRQKDRLTDKVSYRGAPLLKKYMIAIEMERIYVNSFSSKLVLRMSKQTAVLKINYSLAEKNKAFMLYILINKK